MLQYMKLILHFLRILAVSLGCIKSADRMVVKRIVGKMYEHSNIEEEYTGRTSDVWTHIKEVETQTKLRSRPPVRRGVGTRRQPASQPEKDRHVIHVKGQTERDIE